MSIGRDSINWHKGIPFIDDCITLTISLMNSVPDIYYNVSGNPKQFGYAKRVEVISPDCCGPTTRFTSLLNISKLYLGIKSLLAVGIVSYIYCLCMLRVLLLRTQDTTRYTVLNNTETNAHSLISKTNSK